MKVLVTGGGGFLGSSVCRQLAALGYDVIAFQRRPATHLAAAGVQSVQGDIGHPGEVKAAVRSCNAVVHTAAKAGVWGAEDEYWRINVGGTENILEACNAQGIGLLVHTSSPSIVHSGGDVSGVNESIPIAEHFSAAYPESKAEAERLVLAANGDALRTCALRPHLIWGPGDPHILPRLVAKARGGRLALPGADKLIDTIFVENAALAHVKALQELTGKGRCAGNAYFVTNNEPMRQGEIIRLLLAAVGVDVRIRDVPVSVAMAAAAVLESAWKTFRLSSEPPLTRFSVEQLATAHWFNTRAAVRDFGYLPEITIEQGLAILARSHRDGAA